MPDQSKSIQQNAIEPFTKPAYRSHLVDLKRAARARGVRLTTPWRDLRDEERQFVVEGDDDGYTGIKGFFRWLERKKYKVHVRVFLSRYRGYLTCPECDGTRLRREARDVYVEDQSIDTVCGFTVGAAVAFFTGVVIAVCLLWKRWIRKQANEGNGEGGEEGDAENVQLMSIGTGGGQGRTGKVDASVLDL